MRLTIKYRYSVAMKCVLVGNYGVGNVGDEALKEYFLSAFPDIEWAILMAHPTKEQLPRLPAGFRSFISLSWWKTLKAIKQCDAMVFGGGSLFTDVESSFACFLWCIHAWTAYHYRKPYFLAFQGIGPFRTKTGKFFAKWAVKHAAFVSVRDEESFARLQSFIMNTKCERTFDPVILLIRKSYSLRSENVITLIPRLNSGQQFIQSVKLVADQDKDVHFSIILLQPDDSQEKNVAVTILRLVDGRGVIVPVRTFDQLCECIAGSSFVVTQRYHGALAALALHVPVEIVCQAEGDKLSSLKDYANGVKSVEEMFSLAQYGEETLRNALKSILK